MPPTCAMFFCFLFWPQHRWSTRWHVCSWLAVVIHTLKNAVLSRCYVHQRINLLYFTLFPILFCVQCRLLQRPRVQPADNVAFRTLPDPASGIQFVSCEMQSPTYEHYSARSIHTTELFRNLFRTAHSPYLSQTPRFAVFVQEIGRQWASSVRPYNVSGLAYRQTRWANVCIENCNRRFVGA